MSGGYVHSMFIINKAGGLVYNQDFSKELAEISQNDWLILAGTLHGIHAIASKISPVPRSSGIEVIEADNFKMNILLTLTGTKFVIISTIGFTAAAHFLHRVYESYADTVMKSPFHTLEMPIRNEIFDARLVTLAKVNRW